MALISLPQIELAFICTTTWPCPGVGTGKSRNSTVLLPGRMAPVIAEGFVLINFPFIDSVGFAKRWGPGCRLWRRDLAADVPEIFPVLVVSPQEYLSLDEATVPVDSSDCPCLL